jgi:ABC-2 type transport system permease protein
VSSPGGPGGWVPPEKGAGGALGRRPWDVDELIAAVGLTEQARKRVRRLSGGQRRRLDVAIGIVGRPELLFLDEPTAGFDPEARRDFHDLVHRLSDREETTILLTTHDLDEAESVLGMSVGFSGLAMMAGLLTVEHEDGTLLRAKAVPGGMTGYLIGKVVTVSATVVLSVTGTLIAGLFLLDGLAVRSAGAWLTLIWVLALGLVATLPIGAVLGALIPSARSAGLLNLAIGALIAVSGIFYPITHLPQWMQRVGQAFPLYWLGLGMRSALLPAGLASVEIGHSWRHLAAFGVLTAWAILGLVVAPVLLRRMARRESGSSVAARREKAMQQVR